jgi:acid phosphatase family membrane protein YuiD
VVTLSPYFIAILVAWVTAQGGKYVLVALKNRNFDHIRQLYLSGNMPSAHSATTVALATTVGLREGPESALFAVASLFAAIVMYDAIMVRRSVGEQGLAIQNLIMVAKNKRVTLPRAAKGHTPLEVLVGALLGVVIGVVVFSATQ